MKFSSLAISTLPLTVAFAPPPNSGPTCLQKPTLRAEAVSSLPDPTRPIIDPLGLYPPNSPERMKGLIAPLLEAVSVVEKPIFDPLGLYAENSPERMDDRIMPLETATAPPSTRAVVDPLGLYTENSRERKEGLIVPLLEKVPPSSSRKPISDPLGLYPENSSGKLGGLISTVFEAADVQKSPDTPIYDPLGLYPDGAAEWKGGRMEPLEDSLTEISVKEIVDPLRLYADQSQVSHGTSMSPSLPFVARPALLDRTLPGDRGFDPFNFASDANALHWQRRAEIKHARLAMLAAAGWPMAELLHGDIASTLNLPYMLDSADRVPSILNDGLAHTFPVFWIVAIAVVAAIDIGETVEENTSVKLNPADFGFDPLNLGGRTEEQQHFMQEAELFNGRLGMLAITGFAIQERFLGSAVVDQIPIFFKPLNVALEQLMSA